MPKNSPTCRRNMLYYLLKKGPTTISKLHQRYNDTCSDTVSYKTIERDLQYLSKHYKIADTEEYPCHYYVDESFTPDYKLKLNEEQLQATTIALEYLKQTGHDYFATKCQEALTVMLEHLPKGLAHDLEENAKKYFFNTGTSGKPQSKDAKALEQVMHAIRKGKTIYCKNHSPYRDKKYNDRIRHFAPLVFSMTAGVPYLIVQDMDDQNIKRIRATRLSDVEISKFDIDNKLLNDLKNDLHNSFGGYGGINEETVKFEVTCNKVVKTYFQEREIHPSQKIKKISNGRYLITFKVADSFEIPKFLASFGGDIMNVKPKSVFDEIKNIWQSGLKKAG